MSGNRLQAELDWWRDWLSPASLPRLLGVYGMRYLPFWFMDFQDLGRCCDIGSGPISAALVAVSFDQLICVDPNAAQYVDLICDCGIRGVLDWAEMRSSSSKYREASFDTVLCLNTLDHVEDPLPVLKECRRLLHPSGKLLLWTHLRDEDPGDGLHVALNAAQVHQLAAEVGLVHRRSHIGYCETQFGGDPVGEPAFWGTFTR